MRGLAGGRLDPIDVRDGEKGPLVIEVVKRRVQAQDRDGGHGTGGIAVRDAGASSGRHVQA